MSTNNCSTRCTNTEPTRSLRRAIAAGCMLALGSMSPGLSHILGQLSPIQPAHADVQVNSIPANPEAQVDLDQTQVQGGHWIPDRPTPQPIPEDRCGNGQCEQSCNENPQSCPQDCGTCGDNTCDSRFENVGNCPQDCHPCGDGVCTAPYETPESCAQDCPRCGDGQCAPGENESCPQDCQACGDGRCDANEQCLQDCCGDGACRESNGENCGNCPTDCHPTCGDGRCEGTETHASCPDDCPGSCGDNVCDDGENCPLDCCGDGQCRGGETPRTCPQDCPSVCPDGLCESDESSQSCPQDCPDCGDGQCTGNENKQNCPLDCEPCGNHRCDSGETVATCPQDCSGCGDGVCGTGENANNCPRDCQPRCPNGACEGPTENQQTCPQDCGTPPTPVPVTPTPVPTPDLCNDGHPPYCTGQGICACPRCQRPNELSAEEFTLCFGCFTPETKITMADKSVRAIAMIKWGEMVWNPVTQKAMRVKNISAGPEAIPMIQVGYGDVAVTVTEGHPMVIQAASVEGAAANGATVGDVSLKSSAPQSGQSFGYRLARAKDLTTDDKVLGVDGQWHKITVLRRLPVKEGQVVWNLTIDTDSSNPDDRMVLADGMVTGDLVLQNGLADKK